MMSLWDALRMNMMISYQELVRTFLRDFSRSKDDTKARWTVEIIKNEQLNNLQGKVKKPIEIKFR
ncbi:hypothetical protein C5T93_18455 [Raoultella ornithinolytica]|nr:hypothetical protein C5T93_18455 [Raoultella ornithinolytica]